MQHSLGYSQATLTGAFSLSVLLTGAGAIPAGAWLDCCGARGLMTAGSLLAAGCVLLWAQAGSVSGLYLAFAGIGLAGAAVRTHRRGTPGRTGRSHPPACLRGRCPHGDLAKSPGAPGTARAGRHARVREQR
jgi:hypothetical protein